MEMPTSSNVMSAPDLWPPFASSATVHATDATLRFISSHTASLIAASQIMW